MRHLLMSPEITLKLLNKVKKDVINSEYKIPYGMCMIFTKYHEYTIQDCLSQAGVCWSNWPKFSGHMSYPVPSDVEGFTPCTIFTRSNIQDYWNPNKTYGANRMELLDWLIEQLEKKLCE